MAIYLALDSTVPELLDRPFRVVGYHKGVPAVAHVIFACSEKEAIEKATRMNFGWPPPVDRYDVWPVV